MLNDDDKSKAEQYGVLAQLEKLYNAVSEIDGVDDVTFDLKNFNQDNPYIRVSLKHHTPDEHYICVRGKMLRRFYAAASDNGFQRIQIGVSDPGGCCYFYIKVVSEPNQNTTSETEVKHNKMYFEKVPLQERIDLLNKSRCAHQEYIAAEIYRFANLPVTTYFRGMENELVELELLFDISHDTMQDMSYMKLADMIDAKYYDTPTCGKECLHKAMDKLTAPLMRVYSGQSGHGKNPQAVKKPRRISLTKRLETKDSLEDCNMLNMDVKGFLLFMDEMISVKEPHCERAYVQYFQECREQSFIAIVAESIHIPEDRCNAIRYNLLIQPFTYLTRYPNTKWTSKKPI